MRFLRNAGFGARSVAAAAAALIDDETSGGSGRPADADEADGNAGTTDGPENDPPDDDTGDAPDDDTGDDTDEADAGGEDVDDADTGGDAPHSEAALSAGRAQMHSRIEAVFASDECKGREHAASTFLAADLPVDRIIAALGKLPKGEAGNAMLNTLASEAGNAPVVKPGDAEPQPGAKAGKVWEGALARLNPLPTK